MVAEIEASRRAKLREFLFERRSRLRPTEVGLPATSRRRVAGLRREEIAELCEVSKEWYSRLEGGAKVRVSTQFLAKLSGALRPSPLDVIALYHLALHEAYLAYVSEQHLFIPVLSTDSRYSKTLVSSPQLLRKRSQHH